MDFSILQQQVVTVTLRPEAFTDEFMKDYRKHFFDFASIQQHAEHIGQMAARGHFYVPIINSELVEGYGLICEFVKSIDLGGIKSEQIICDE